MLVPGYAKAAGKNQSDVAKLKKIVNEQIKKGADLSGDVVYDTNYTWDKNGNLKSIRWSERGLSGSIVIPSFTRLKSICIESNAKLKKVTIMDNKYLEELDCHGGEYGCGYRRVVKLKKLVIHGCKNLRNLSAGNNGKIELGFSAGDFKKLNKLYLGNSNLKEIDLSKNQELAELDLSENQLRRIDLSKNRKLTSLRLTGNRLAKINLSKN